MSLAVTECDERHLRTDSGRTHYLPCDHRSVKRLCVTVAAGLAVFATLPVFSASADSVRDGQWYLSALNVSQAWQATRGAGERVCVIDSGIDDQVPDLIGAVAAHKLFTKFVNSDGLSTSHGTGVASVLAGRGHGPNHSEGVIGIAPAATLLDAVIGESDRNVNQQVAAALRWCTDQDADVINMSFGALNTGPVATAVAYAESKDIVLVAASTNTFEHLKTRALPNPAGLPGVLAVTGIDKDLKSDPGAFNSSVGKKVSLAAPFSTTVSGADADPAVGLPVADVRTAVAQGAPYVQHASGTSYSAPIVAGTAALIRAAHPKMNADDVISALLATATPTGSGRPNRTYGWGIVNVGAAVTADLPASSGNPLITGDVPAFTPPAPSSSAPESPATNSAAQPNSTAQPNAAARTGSSSATLWYVVVAAIVILTLGVGAVVRSHRRT